LQVKVSSLKLALGEVLLTNLTTGEGVGIQTSWEENF